MTGLYDGSPWPIYSAFNVLFVLFLSNFIISNFSPLQAHLAHLAYLWPNTLIHSLMAHLAQLWRDSV